VKFANTSWWVAWSLADDGRHPDALGMLAHLGGAEQVLTNLVVGETWTFLRRKDGHRSALALLDRVGALQEQTKLTVHRVTVDRKEKAWGWLGRHDERSYSFVDATSFEVMRHRRLPEALAFDQGFAAAGFIEIQP
jgi:predicted nucleic acid-binding protein